MTIIICDMQFENLYIQWWKLNNIMVKNGVCNTHFKGLMVDSD
jgi:hypothetical protein